MASDQDLPSANFQTDRNCREHRTDGFISKRLIVRRAQPFDITLDFKYGGFKEKANQIIFTARTGPNETTFSVSHEEPINAWSAVLKARNPRSLNFTIFSPSNAIIGKYLLFFQFSSEEEPIKLGEFILLFNSWHPDDAVFLKDETEREEYVMNENGIIFQGNYNWIQALPWNFGQFEPDIVDICLALLDRSLYFLKNPDADYSRRGNPVYVSRVISAMINANDDNGVLEGKWTGEYTEGTKPTDWNGSVTILKQWRSNGYKAVKYGQCWVFAGVLCTVMRCLGIPTRVVSNFESAHDSNGDLIIDQYFDKDGKYLKEEGTDSIWNFHVWNECWMSRPELTSWDSGWQVLDATPQEPSNGIFCCGPASVKAIKNGFIYKRYDSTFVYAEVNADVISWVLEDKEKKKVHTDVTTVGRFISTKSVGSNERLDITDNYKYKEGFPQEREVYYRAVQNSSRR